MRISDWSSDVCSSDLMKAGTFDAGYTLEPNGTVMNKTGAAHTVEAGVVSKYIIGRESAYAFMAGGAITGKFMKERPEVAKRFSAAWRKALKDIEQDPTTRELLKGNTFTTADRSEEHTSELQSLLRTSYAV